MEPQKSFGPQTIDQLRASIPRPFKVVVTAGMPYANGPIHIGHLAGAFLPPDIFARWMRMVIGAENVLFVCGTDDHGSTSELSALKAGKDTKSFLKELHGTQKQTLSRYNMSLDVYSGTSRDECYPLHKEFSQNLLRKLYRNGLLEKRTTLQWFDPKLSRFLQDRYVTGKCPNLKCANDRAYSDECEVCGAKYDPADLLMPKSGLSEATPELKPTVHWWLDLWKVSEPLRTWIQTKEKSWRPTLFSEVINTVLPSLKFDNIHESKYKELKDQLPAHKSKYAAGKKVVIQCNSKVDLELAKSALEAKGIPTAYLDDWAHRSISRDVSWGIPMPEDLDPEMKGKTLYVWPDSLIAPIIFTKVALILKGKNPDSYTDYWCSPKSKIYQFLGQDNVYFYTLMQGAMWLGSQADPTCLPGEGDLQLTEVFSVNHLLVDGEKMSKSRGNAYSGDELILEKGNSADQLRYFLASLSLADKASNFDFNWLAERNKFLAGPMNAAFEKPISACHSKFGGRVPDGKLNAKVEAETTKLIQRYFKSMERADYPVLLGAIENYARQINSMFTQFKPHDDRAPDEERRDALFTCFYVLKNLVIMLHPFVPDTMDRVRKSLNLPRDIYHIDSLGTPMPSGHQIGEMAQYFPAVAE
ncbi:MAG: class I tRNA ligase family protein [Proteobacteria bacterium]|nr:class I tRNA ligase family protein [Pseudomonadota bacterium]